jgi:hypothetical protein
MRKMMPKTLTEHEEQVALFNKKGCPPLLYAIPNGGLRNKIVAMKLKAEGVLAGIPDTHYPVARLGYHSLYIEMKRLKPRGMISNHQQVVMEALAKEDNLVYVCWGAEAAWTILNNYMNSKLTFEDKDWERVGKGEAPEVQSG